MKFTHLVIHCTATVAGNPVTKDQLFRWHMGLKKNKDGTFNYRGKSYKSLDEVPKEIFHGLNSLKTSGRGWGQVGYSDMFHLDGKIENLVPYDEDEVIERAEVTNGAFGMNAKARHIVYVGGLKKLGEPADTRTDAQKESMKKYVLETIKLHPDIIVVGHKQCPGNATGCPEFEVPQWLVEIGVDEKNMLK